MQYLQFKLAELHSDNATFCSLIWQGLTRISQFLPSGLTEINCDKPVFILVVINPFNDLTLAHRA